MEWDDRSLSIAVKLAPLSLSILQFVPYTEEELEKVIAQRVKKNAPVKKSITKAAPKKETTKKSTGGKTTAKTKAKKESKK